MSVDLRAADAARPDLAPDVEVSIVQCNLSPVVEARLTQVVQRLRGSWLAGPALLWGDVHSIREVAGGEFDERVTTTLASGFFQFSQFLAGFEMLVLELQKSGVVSEKSLLGLEQLLQQGRGLFVDEGGIAGCTQSLGDIASSGD